MKVPNVYIFIFFLLIPYVFLSKKLFERPRDIYISREVETQEKYSIIDIIHNVMYQKRDVRKSYKVNLVIEVTRE